jgi:hypothetical protein
VQKNVLQVRFGFKKNRVIKIDQQFATSIKYPYEFTDVKATSARSYERET